MLGNEAIFAREREPSLGYIKILKRFSKLKRARLGLLW
jgi:hypothetical protein